MCSENCSKCIRILMIVFNCIFVMCGIAVCALSLYVYYANPFFSALSASQLSVVHIVLYVVIALSAACILLSVCASCGAFFLNRCLLATFATFLLLIFLCQLAAGLYIWLQSSYISELMAKVLQIQVDRLVKGSASSSSSSGESLGLGVTAAVTMATSSMGAASIKPTSAQDNLAMSVFHITNIQKLRQCCGVKGPSDYLVSGSQSRIPISCRPGLNESASPYQLGCHQAVINFVSDRLPLIAGVVLGIALIELLGIVFSFVLCCSANRFAASSHSHEYVSVNAGDPSAPHSASGKHGDPGY